MADERKQFDQTAAGSSVVEIAHSALVLAKNEMIASSNWYEKAYGWPEASKRVDEAIVILERAKSHKTQLSVAAFDDLMNDDIQEPLRMPEWIDSKVPIRNQFVIPAEQEEFSQLEATLAYTSACSLIESNCMTEEDGHVGFWWDLHSAECDLTDEVKYLHARGLLDLHPEKPHWVRLRDEDEPSKATQAGYLESDHLDKAQDILKTVFDPGRLEAQLLKIPGAALAQLADDVDNERVKLFAASVQGNGMHGGNRVVFDVRFSIEVV